MAFGNLSFCVLYMASAATANIGHVVATTSRWRGIDKPIRLLFGIAVAANCIANVYAIPLNRVA